MDVSFMKETSIFHIFLNLKNILSSGAGPGGYTLSIPML